MIKILHRINTKIELANTQKTYGVEVDIRSHKEKPIIKALITVPSDNKRSC